MTPSQKKLVVRFYLAFTVVSALVLLVLIGAEAYIRWALRRLLEDNPGPQTQAVLTTRIAVATGNIEAIFTELADFEKTLKSSGD
jgi:hypothetical protein